MDETRWVVKSRRTYAGVERTSVLTQPMPLIQAMMCLADLKAEYQNPGNYYIERWMD